MLDKETQAQPAPTVSMRVMEAFVEAVKAEPDMAAVAARLHAALIEKDDLSEAALQAAIFEGDAS
jgi:hypothetical protein